MSDLEAIPGLRDIEYRSGQKLDLRPVNNGDTRHFVPTRDEMLHWTAAQLLEGQTVHVMLEPGDMTLYDFYLIPMWGAGMRPRYLNHSDAQRFVLLCQHNLDQKTVLVPFSHDDSEVYFALSEMLRNEWTCQLISSFMLHLADMAKTVSERKQAAFQRLEEITSLQTKDA